MTQARVILGEGPSTEKMSPDLPVVHFLYDCFVRVQFTVGGATLC